MADYAALIRPTELLEGPTPMRTDELGVPALFTESARFRPGAFARDLGSNCSAHPRYDDRIRRPASSSISLTHAPCITSTCIVRPACRMRFVISCIVLTTSGWSGWPG